MSDLMRSLAAFVLLLVPAVGAGTAVAGPTPEEQIMIFYDGVWTQTEDALACGWGFVTYTGDQSNQGTVERLGRDGDANTRAHFRTVEGTTRPAADAAAEAVAYAWGPGADDLAGDVNDVAHDVKCLVLHGVLIPISETAIWKNPPAACFAKSTTTCGAAVIDCDAYYAFDLADWALDPGAGPYPRACTPPGVPTTPVTREVGG